MNAQVDILERGLEQAALAVLGDRHLEPAHIGRGLEQRISGRLRQVESLVRRILSLMAPAPCLCARPACPVTCDFLGGSLGEGDQAEAWSSTTKGPRSS